MRCRINPRGFDWYGANIGYLQRVSDAGGGAKTMASARTYLEQLAGDQDVHI
jgi:hypothetical protein